MKKLLSYFLVCSLMAGFLLNPAWAQDVTLEPGESYCFAESDFSESAPVKGILITSVPDATMGSLRLGSRILSPGDVITSQQLSGLQLQAADGDGDTTLTCIALTEEGLGEEAEMTFHIGKEKNLPPVAENSEFFTYKNIPGNVPLTYQDPENDPVTILIQTAPKRGEVLVAEDGTVTYTPKKNKVGKDSFTYILEDSAGNRSQEATVRVEIKKPSDKETYGDVAGTDAELPAMWLKDTGVFRGETISGQLLFQPEKPVTRGEFLTMCMSLSGEEPREDAISTGFLDEDATQDWLRPYVTTALACGIISGRKTEDGLVLAAEETITEGEAAVILTKTLSLPIPDDQTVMNLDDSVPVWASGSVSAVMAAGLADNVAYAESLDRGEAAELLYRVALISGNYSPSLLSWAQE